MKTIPTKIEENDFLLRLSNLCDSLSSDIIMLNGITTLSPDTLKTMCRESIDYYGACGWYSLKRENYITTGYCDADTGHEIFLAFYAYR